jgi:hypothetical protein
MKKGAVAFVTYCALTVALTYPLILHMGSVLPNDAGDPALNTWILWWNSHNVPLTDRWWNAPAFFPVRGVLSFSEHLLGLTLISTPLYWLGADPQTAYNIVFLLTFPLSALGAYFLGYELTKRHDAAFIAGLLFGFAPYRIAHMAQIQALASFPMPFALAGLHRYLHEPRARWLALFASAWLVQALSNGYYLLFFSVLTVLWILWFANPLRQPRAFLAIGAAWALAALAVLPLLMRYRSIHAGFGFSRDFDTVRHFSADVAALLHASPHLALWGWLHVFRREEGELFGGITITLLLAAGVILLRTWTVPPTDKRSIVRTVLALVAATGVAAGLASMIVGRFTFEPFGIRLLSVSTPVNAITRSLLLALALAVTSRGFRRAYVSRSVLAFYVIAALVMWVLSLGPVPALTGVPLVDRGPYALLMFFPGFNALRVPARFWMVATLCLSVMGAVIFDRLTSARGRVRVALAVIVSIAAVSDAWMRAMPLAAAPVMAKALQCEGAGDGPLVEMPLGDSGSDVAAMYRQMSHRRPIVNGYSGYLPPHYPALRVGFALHDPSVLTLVAARENIDVLVHEDLDRGGELNAYVRSHPGAEHICTQDRGSLYRLSMTTDAHEPTPRGTQLPLARVSANVNDAAIHLAIDGDPTTRWHSGPQTENTTVDVDLGSTRTVTGVDVLLSSFADDFPRGLVIELSDNAGRWRSVWQGSSAALAYKAALEAPRELTLKYRFPPGDGRMLRLRQTLHDSAYYWSIAELLVLGP